MASPYIPDPATRDTPLQIDEVKALRALGAKAFKDPRVIEHFLARAETTLEVTRQEFNRLHRQVQMISAERQHQGMPTSLDPASAAKFLPPEEIDRMASAHLQQMIEQVRTALTEIADAQRRVTGRVNAIKFAVAALLEEGALDAETRTKFLSMVRALPDPAPEPIPSLDALLPQPQPQSATPADHAEVGGVGPDGLDGLFD